MGHTAANMAVTECDLLLALGVRFDDRVTGKLELFSALEKVHIDIDPSEFHKNVTVEHPIVGDVKKALHMLLHMSIYTQTDEWLQKVKAWKEEYPLSYKQKNLS